MEQMGTGVLIYNHMSISWYSCAQRKMEVPGVIVIGYSVLATYFIPLYPCIKKQRTPSRYAALLC